MFIAIKLMYKDGDVIDFGLVFMLALIPAIVMFLTNLAIGILKISDLFSLLGLTAGIIIVFLMSKNAFEWSKARAASLAAIYLVTIIGTEVLIMEVFT